MQWNTRLATDSQNQSGFNQMQIKYSDPILEWHMHHILYKTLAVINSLYIYSELG